MGYRNVTEILGTGPHKGAWIVQCAKRSLSTNSAEDLDQDDHGRDEPQMLTHTIKEKHHELKS